MKLTGKCKTAFKIWFIENITLKSSEIIYESFILSDFYNLTPSMQYGVYVDWFDSTGMDIEIAVTPSFREYYCMINDDADDPDLFKTRHEARTKAISKANEIYNESN